MAERLALTFFIFLFPLIFFYSSAVGAELIIPFIGGGFGFVAAIALASLFPLLLASSMRLKGNAGLMTALFFALVIYTIAWLFVHHVLGNYTQSRADVFVQWATLIATWLTLFSIGYFFPPTLSRAYVRLLLACMAGIAATVLTNIDYRRLIFLFGVSEAEGALSYQGLARSAAVTGLVLLSVTRNMRISILIAIILLITLFFIGARSELLGVVAAFPFIFYLHFLQRPLATITTAMIVGLIGLGFVAYTYEELSTSRQFQILNIAESTSGMARADLRSQALEATRESPVFGDFAGHAKNYDEIGNYSHDILSAWRQLGIVGFLLYLSLLILPLLLSIAKLRKPLYQGADLPRITGTLSLFCLILTIGAKSIFWALPALTWGLAVASCRKQSINSTPN